MHDIVVVNVSSSRILDDENIMHFGDLLNSLIEQDTPQRILLNFANVECLSSASLGKLIVFRKKLVAVNGKLALSNIEPTVFEAFKITGFTRLFIIFDEEQEAYEYLQKQ